MRVPPCLSKLTAPTNLLAVQSEVLGHPQDRIGHSTEFSSTELLIDPLSKAPETEASLLPWIGPPESLVVVYDFSC